MVNGIDDPGQLSEYSSLLKQTAQDHSFLEEKKDDDKGRFSSYHYDDEDEDEDDEVLFFPKGRSPSRIFRIFLVVVVLFVLVLILAVVNERASHWSPASLSEEEGFDYIVVGGGPSGIITATKLAKAFPHLSVLLLESGTDSQEAVIQHTIEQEPSLMSPVQSTTAARDKGTLWEGGELSLNKFDVPLMWSGVASDQGRRQVTHMEESWSEHHWPIKRTLLGRALGGCGLFNAMISVRALPADFAGWNLTGWTFENMLPRYVAMERFVETSAKFTSSFWKDDEKKELQSWRGTSGPVTTVPAGVGVDAIAPLFVESALASGHSLAERGFNSPHPSHRIGAGYYEFNVRNGVRDSIANAFLGHAGRPRNLLVQTGVTVTRVLTSAKRGGDGRPSTIGVEYVRDRYAHAGKLLLKDEDRAEVILASGAILTPQLLSNSGIGPGGHVVDVPGVGQNLQDHPVTAIAFQISPEVAQQASSIYTVADEMEDYFLSVAQLQSLQDARSEDVTEDVIVDVQTRLGTFGTAGFSAGAFLRSPWAEDESPDIQLTVFPRVIEPHVTRKVEEKDTAFARSYAMLVTIALLKPDARYEVRPSQSEKRLVQRWCDSSLGKAKDASTPTQRQQSPFRTEVDTSNPLAKIIGYRLPSIEVPIDRTKYLSTRDAKRIAWGMEQVRDIQKMPPLADQTENELYPGANITGEDLERYVHDNSLANSHWVGSTKMGKADDPLAVVDEELRVRGVRGLRIVDSGVIPLISNGNTHSTVCVVASRGADLIVEARRNRW